MTRNAIQCAHLEVAKIGHFELSGRLVYFRSAVTGESYVWSFRDANEAKKTLSLFRAAPKYTKATEFCV